MFHLCFRRGEIREVIVHVGAPTVTSRLADFLQEVECAKRCHLSDRSCEPGDFLAELVCPDIPSRFCSDPGILKGNTGPNFGNHCRAMVDFVDLLMDRFAHQQNHPTYCLSLKAMEIGAKQYDKEGTRFWTSKRKKKQARKNGPPQYVSIYSLC